MRVLAGASTGRGSGQARSVTVSGVVGSVGWCMYIEVCGMCVCVCVRERERERERDRGIETMERSFLVLRKLGVYDGEAATMCAA